MKKLALCISSAVLGVVLMMSSNSFAGGGSPEDPRLLQNVPISFLEEYGNLEAMAKRACQHVEKDGTANTPRFRRLSARYEKRWAQIQDEMHSHEFFMDPPVLKTLMSGTCPSGTNDVPSPGGQVG